MVRRSVTGVVAALLGLLLSLLLPGFAHAAAPATPRPLVVLGAAGLRWADLSPGTTPTLWRLADRSAIGSLVTRTARPVTCAADGWLSLGVGARGQAVPHGGRGGSQETCPASRPSVTVTDGGARVDGWDTVESFARRSVYAVTPGLLGRLLDTSGCATAVGPGAALAVALPDGSVPRYRAAPGDLTTADVRACPVTAVDLDGGAPPAEGHADALRRLDAAAATVLATADGAGPSTPDVLLLGVSADARGNLPHLAVAAYAAPGTAGHWLTSSATRRPTLSQITDATETVLRSVGVPAPPEMVGSPQTAGGTRPDLTTAVRHLVRADEDEQTARGAQAGLWTGLVVLQVLLYVGVGVALRRSWGGELTRRRALRTAWAAGLVFGAAPLATFLADIVPWERAPLPDLVLLLLVVGLAAVVAAAAALGPWRHRPLGPMAAVAGATGLVLGVDVLLGGQLQEGSLMGYFPTVAGRFYGFGNQAFSLFATGMLLGAAGLAALLLRVGRGPRTAAYAVAAVGLVTLALDGAPMWGADVGGVPAVVPAFAFLALRVAGARVSFTRLALALAGAVGVLAVLGAIDAARPPDARTHLGRFVVDLVHGEGGQTVRRKLGSNLSLLVSTPLTLLLPAAFLFVVLVLSRPARWHAPALDRAYDREPLLRPTLVALLVLQVLAFALNDSGVALPAVALSMVLPLLIAASAQALQSDAAGTPTSRTAPPPAPAAPPPPRRTERRSGAAPA